MNERPGAGPTEADRSYARVELRVPVRVRVLEEGEVALLAERLEAEPSYEESAALAGRRPAREELTWEQAATLSLLARLDAVERALGRIADHLGVDLSDGLAWIEGEAVSLSGSGLGVHLPQKLAEDTPVEIELTLVGQPTARVRALGRVACLVRPDGDGVPVGRFHLGIAFAAMHPEDRQAVIRYTFQLQRAELRRRRDGGDAPGG